MGYKGLFLTEATFFLIIAVWFIIQLDWFSSFKSINDPKGILPPTITLLVGFIFIPNIVNFYSSLSEYNLILELLKSSTPLIAISTFFLGQFISTREREKDRKEKQKIAAYKMIDSLEHIISDGGSLHNIEKKLKQSKSQDFNYVDFQSCCKNELIEIDNLIKKCQANNEIFNIENKRDLIVYFRRVKEFFNFIITDYYTELDVISGLMLYFAEHHIIVAYKYILYFAQNIIKDDILIERTISDLQFKKRCLNRSIKIRNKRKKLLDDNSDMSQFEKIKDDYFFLEYDEDMESELIKEIDNIISNS